VTPGRGEFLSAEFSLKPIGENSDIDSRRRKASSLRRKSKPAPIILGMILPDAFSKDSTPMNKELSGGSMGPSYKSINKKIGTRISQENSRMPRDTLFAGQLLLNIINKPPAVNGLTQSVKKNTQARSLVGADSVIFLIFKNKSLWLMRSWLNFARVPNLMKRKNWI
jgi:hypothetical protein